MRRTELIINGVSIDVENDVAMPLTYAISDIKNPDQRVGSHSKTIELPGTPSVNQLFSHIFDVNYDIQNTSSTNFSPDFNPNLKATAIVNVDTIEQFRGYMRLRSIVRDRQNLDKIKYKVELFGELANIIQLMGDAKLSDLGFEEFDHDYNRTKQKNSWTGSYVDGYFYPMINYGNSDGLNWKVEDFYPAIYVRQYWDKIFQYVGCSYSGSFCSASPFTNLVVPFTGESFKLSQTQVDDRKFSATTSAQTDVLGASNFYSTFASPFIFDVEAFDTDNQYDTGTGLFTCVDAGHYEFVMTGTFFFSAVGANVVGTGAYPSMMVHFYRQRGSTVTFLNGTNISGAFYGTTLLSGNSTPSVTFTYSSDTTEVEVGDIIYCKIYGNWLGTITSGSANLQFSLQSGSFYNTVNNPTIVEGNTLQLNQAIPDDVRMADFFLSIVKEFNLMIEPVRSEPNSYVIETANTFYTGGVTRNWSEKLDVSQPVDIQPMGALDARRYVLKRTDSDDYFNKAYREEWMETYGMKKHDVSNDFLKNVNEFESIFVDTPLVGRNSDDRVYPEIYTLDSSGNPKPTSSGLRMLYVGGELSTGFSWNYVTDGGTYSETTYPYAGHLDDPTTPTLDLSFATPRRVYYNAQIYTDGNLWNTYHKTFITEITDKNSKIITASFYLKPLDILLLSFRDVIYLDIAGLSGYYRLQKVMDYDPTKEGVTKCELLKIIAASKFGATTYSVANYAGSTVSLTNTVISRPRTVEGVSLGVGRDVLSTERNSGSIVGGESNRLGVGAERITILSSSGVTVFPEVRGATVINSDDVTITEDGEIWIDGNKYVGGSSQIHTVTTSQTITGAGTYYCTGLLTLTLSTSVLTVNDRIQVFNMDSSTVTVAGGGVNIVYANNNSVASFSMNHKYESLTLTWTGSNYIIT
jgi:hypothetical protein